MSRITEERSYAEFADRVVENLAQRATVSDVGIKWVQAEHRVRPELLQAQTGFMQGAAGVGSFFVHVDQMRRGKKPGIVLPDSPVGGGMHG